MSTHDQDTAVTDVSREVRTSEGPDCLVVIHHEMKTEQGKRVNLDGTRLRIGRNPDNEIVLDARGVSRQHVRLERRAFEWLVMDVGSRNGTLLNDRELSGVSVLKSGDRLKVGAVVLKFLSGTDLERDFLEEIYNLTITDHVAGVHNKFHFSNELAKEFARARRHERPLSLIMLDIDHFKRFNDEHGHLAGDAVLQHIGQLLRTSVRTHDVVARYGGEEFALLLPETALAEAGIVAEKLRTAIFASSVEFRQNRLAVTVSIGCAELVVADANEQDLIARADEKLYAAKDGGRNCVVL